MSTMAPQIREEEITTDDSGLPEGWCLSHLDEIGHWSTGGTPSRKEKRFFGGKIPWIKSGELNDGLVENAEEAITQAAIQSSAAKLLPAGTLSVALYGATIGKLGILGFPAATNQACANCVVIESLVNRWFVLFYLLGQRSQLIEAGQGGAQPNINNQIVRDWPFLLPPRAEQDRIVSKLQAILKEVERSTSRIANVPNILQVFRQTVLAAACSGKLTEDWRRRNRRTDAKTAIDNAARQHKSTIRRGVPESVDIPDEILSIELPSTWAAESVASLLRAGVLIDLKDGNHGSNHPKVAEFTSTGLPFITAAQVKDFRIDYEEAPKISGKALERLKVGFAEPEDAILTHKGTVGRTALNTRACVLTPQTTYYRANSNLLDSRFLVYFLASSFFYRQLAMVMSQTTRDFVPISEQYLKFIFVPPIEEQLELVRRVETLFKLADAIEKRVAAASARAQNLTQAVLAKAFRGELVPTEAELARQEERMYEPASVLLERIKAERAVQSTNGKISKKKKARSAAV